MALFRIMVLLVNVSLQQKHTHFGYKFEGNISNDNYEIKHYTTMPNWAVGRKRLKWWWWTCTRWCVCIPLRASVHRTGSWPVGNKNKSGGQKGVMFVWQAERDKTIYKYIIHKKKTHVRKKKILKKNFPRKKNFL